MARMGEKWMFTYCLSAKALPKLQTHAKIMGQFALEAFDPCIRIIMGEVLGWNQIIKCCYSSEIKPLGWYILLYQA